MFATATIASGIELRQVAVGDAPALAWAYHRNRAHLARWDPLRPEEFYRPDAQARIIQQQLREREQGRLIPLVIVADGRACGRVTVSNIVRGALLSGDLGYWLDATLTGRGVMTQAVRCLLEFAFEHEQLHRVAASTLPENSASQTVLRRCGFRQIGLAPKFLKIAGRWQDHLLFQRLASDAAGPCG